MSRQRVLGTGSGRRRTGRILAGVMTGVALVGALLVGPPAAAQAAPPPTAAAAESCGGPLAFGVIVDCAKIDVGATHTYSVTTTAAGERLAARLVGSHLLLQAELTGLDGARLCYVFEAPSDCVVPKAGTYALTVVNPDRGSASLAADYRVSVDSMTNPSDCVELAAASFAVSAPGRDDKLPAGSTGRCYQFDQPARATLKITAQPRAAGLELQGQVVNSAGTVVCDARKFRSCTLTGAGPYRLFVLEWDGVAVDYHLSATRMSDPEGCRESSPAAFGGPDDRVLSGTLADSGPVCFTFPASAGPHLLVIGKGSAFLWQLYDGTGRELTCQRLTYGAQCTLPADGRLNVFVVHSSAGPQDYLAAVYPLAGTQGCAPARQSASNTMLYRATMRSPVQVDCQFIDAEPGDRVEARTPAKGWLAGNSGERICELDTTGCVLTGAGPHRVMSIGTWSETTTARVYSVFTKLVTDAKGCLPVGPGRYGTSAAGILSSGPCRVLTVRRPGRYRVELVDSSNNPGTGTITDSAGTRICDTGWCTFPAAGRYRLATELTHYATVLLPETGAADSGCVPASDDPAAADLSLNFLGVGEYDCLELPTAAGDAVMLSRPRNLPTRDPLVVSVQDATGTATCNLRQLTDRTCVLRGTAPFRAVVSQRADLTQVLASYSMAFVRIGVAPACPVLAAGSFGTTPTTNVTFDATHRLQCFSVPASAHTAAEVVSFQSTGPGGRAEVSVFGGNGRQVCRTGTSTAHFALCRLDPGAATILVEGSTASDTLFLARRDVTGTAAGCRPIGSTTVGAPSIAGTVTDGGDVQCYRVPAEPADRLVIGARDATNKSRTLVVDPAGADTGCTAQTGHCSVTGSAGYQVLVWGDGATGGAAYQLNAWKLWSAAGPAKECTAVPSSAYGFGPYTGTLTSAAPAVCLLTTRRQDRDLSLAVVNPATSTDGFPTGLYAVTGSAMQACAAGAGGRFTCPAGKEAVEQTAYLLTLAARVKPHPYSWAATCATPLCGDETFAVTAVTPAALTAGGTRSLTIRGTALHLGDTVRVIPAGSAPVTATVTAVSADRTVLTATVDLTAAAGGPATVEIRAFGAGVGTITRTDAVTITVPVLRATTAPSITGKAAVGATLTAGAGQWTPAPTAYTYQWAAGGAPIKGATARTYVIPAGMLGKRLTVTVTATRPRATSGSATSAPTAAVAKGAAPKATKKPAIGGTAKVGRTVTATAGAWSPKAESYRYEWRLNGTIVRGATGRSLKLTAAMRSKRLTVTVIAVKKGYAGGRALSSPVSVRK